MKKGKFEVCVFVTDWVTLMTYDTYEEAKQKLIELYNETQFDYAVIKDGFILIEYKP